MLTAPTPLFFATHLLRNTRRALFDRVEPGAQGSTGTPIRIPSGKCHPILCNRPVRRFITDLTKEQIANAPAFDFAKLR